LKKSKKGKMIYVPKIVIEELHNIKVEKGLDSRSAAFKNMVNNARVGREIEIMREKFLLTDLFKKRRPKK
jgi:hypothetical protein